MKIRSGFVSNSSSSSFIVHYKDMLATSWKNNKTLKRQKPELTKNKIKLLEEFGFWKTGVYYPDQVRWQDKNKEDFDEFYHYGYELACNEWEVLEFLLKNEIPFKSLCHYEHYFIQYDGKDTVIVARNFGKEYMMYGDITDDEYDKKMVDEKPIWETSVEKFLEKGNYYED